MTITDYVADFHVGRDGNLSATETITGEFPAGRHGIFRYWDVAEPNDPHVRHVPTISSVLMDGQPITYEMFWERSRFRVAKIGDPDHFLVGGAHVFEIRYSIPGVLGRGEGGATSTFHWDVIAPAWNNDIERADITVALPAGVIGATCSVGHSPDKTCQDLAVNGSTVTVVAADLAPHTPVNVRVGVDLPPPPRATLPWSHEWDAVLGRSLTAVGRWPR